MSAIVKQLEDAGVDITGVTHIVEKRSEAFFVPGYPNQENQHAFNKLPEIGKMLSYLGKKLRICTCKVGDSKVVDRIIVDY